MNRKIKFRVWCKRINKMVSPQYAASLDEDGTMNISPFHILMQWTGLKDKNEVDVYEGDIVQNNSRRSQVLDHKISKIVYRIKGFWVEDESFGWEGENLWDWNELEVIGNIYQNPELLKRKVCKRCKTILTSESIDMCYTCQYSHAN